MLSKASCYCGGIGRRRGLKLPSRKRGESSNLSSSTTGTSCPIIFLISVFVLTEKISSLLRLGSIFSLRASQDIHNIVSNLLYAGMAEWFKALVLKTSKEKSFEGSNPSARAIMFILLFNY